jgi:hypothetical protein
MKEADIASIRDSYASIEGRLDDTAKARWQKFFAELEEVREANKKKDIEREKFLLRSKNGLHRFDHRDMKCECGMGFYDYHLQELEQKTGPCPASNYTGDWRHLGVDLPAEVDDLILESHRYPLVDRVAARLSRLELTRKTMREVIKRLRICKTEWFAKAVWQRIMSIRRGDFFISDTLRRLSDQLHLDIKQGA